LAASPPRKPKRPRASTPAGFAPNDGRVGAETVVSPGLALEFVLPMPDALHKPATATPAVSTAATPVRNPGSVVQKVKKLLGF
jgi:hypothetical protein